MPVDRGPSVRSVLLLVEAVRPGLMRRSTQEPMTHEFRRTLSAPVWIEGGTRNGTNDDLHEFRIWRAVPADSNMEAPAAGEFHRVYTSLTEHTTGGSSCWRCGSTPISGSLQATMCSLRIGVRSVLTRLIVKRWAAHRECLSSQSPPRRPRVTDQRVMRGHTDIGIRPATASERTRIGEVYKLRSHHHPDDPSAQRLLQGPPWRVSP
jgi:hypothetical protein